jgi:hypothetical protein
MNLCPFGVGMVRGSGERERGDSNPRFTHKDKLSRLDVNKGDVRDKVRAVGDNQHLRQLFESVA